MTWNPVLNLTPKPDKIEERMTVKMIIERIKKQYRNIEEHNICSFELIYIHGLESFLKKKKLGFTPCKAEQLLQGTDLQEKETQKD